MPVNLDGWILCEHGVQCLLIVNSAFEGGAHRIDHQSRTILHKKFLEFPGDHAAMLIRGNNHKVEVLQIGQTHIGIMSRI